MSVVRVRIIDRSNYSTYYGYRKALSEMKKKGWMSVRVGVGTAFFPDYISFFNWKNSRKVSYVFIGV